MSAFLKVDFDLLQSGLSDGAVLLFSFIQYRMFKAKADENGNKYINWSGDNDPRQALGITRRQLQTRTEELKDAGLIHSEGHGESYRLYMGPSEEKTEASNKNVASPSNNNVAPEQQKCCPPGYKNVASPNKNNKQVCRNSRSVCRRSNTHAPVIIPTMAEIEDEAKACGYKTDTQRFYNYNRMRGWQGIQDWRIALSIWAEQDSRHGKSGRSLSGADAGIVFNPVNIEPQPAVYPGCAIPDLDSIPTIEIDIDNILDAFGG